MSNQLALSRRYFFFGAFAALNGCRTSSNSRRSNRSRISIIRTHSYQHDLRRVVRDLFDEHHVQVRAKTVVIKPNLVEFSAYTPINTNPVLVAAVLEELRSRGASEVRVAEGPGHRRSTLDLASSAGYFDAIQAFEKSFTDLNVDDVARVKLTNPFSTLSELYLPKTVLRCDLLISLAKMKTHHWAGATLAMKNLFGVVPGAVYGWPKNVLHWAGINECIADLHTLLPRQFCIVDGIEAMEGNGPILGTPKSVGLIVGGADPIGVDATCCRIMGIDPESLKYLRLSAPGRLNEDNFEQLGETIRSTQKTFALPPGLEHLRLTTLD